MRMLRTQIVNATLHVVEKLSQDCKAVALGSLAAK